MPDGITHISETLIIPPSCRENFISVYSWPGRPFRDRDVKGAGLSELYEPYEIRREKPDTHLCMYTVDGGATIYTPKGKLSLTPGTLWISPAGAPQMYQCEKHWKTFWFHLYDTDRWSNLKGHTCKVLQAKNLPKMHSAVEGFVNESLSNLHGASELAEAYAHAICIYLERDLLPHGDSDEDHMMNSLISLWNRIDAGISHRWTVNEMASIMHISPATLHRVVLCHYEKTPMEMVEGIRMRRAEQLLLSTDYTLEHIGLMVGYANPFAFSRAFKRHTGTAPREFRRQGWRADSENKTGVDPYH